MRMKLCGLTHLYVAAMGKEELRVLGTQQNARLPRLPTIVVLLSLAIINKYFPAEF